MNLLILDLRNIKLSTWLNVFPITVHKYKKCTDKKSFKTLCVVKSLSSNKDDRQCASHLISPIPSNRQLPQSPNSVPLLLKLEYINKSCLHINNCSFTHSNLLKYTLIYKDNVFFPSKSMYELRLIFISSLTWCPFKWTDVKSLHNQAEVNSDREPRQSFCSCILFTVWMMEVIWTKQDINKTTKSCYLNIHNHVPFPKRKQTEKKSCFCVTPPLKNASFLDLIFSP